jgi:hypothetical protein
VTSIPRRGTTGVVLLATTTVIDFSHFQTRIDFRVSGYCPRRRWTTGGGYSSPRRSTRRRNGGFIDLAFDIPSGSRCGVGSSLLFIPSSEYFGFYVSGGLVRFEIRVIRIDHSNRHGGWCGKHTAGDHVIGEEIHSNIFYERKSLNKNQNRIKIKTEDLTWSWCISDMIVESIVFI